MQLSGSLDEHVEHVSLFPSTSKWYLTIRLCTHLQKKEEEEEEEEEDTQTNAFV